MSRTAPTSLVRAFLRFNADLRGWNQVPMPTFRVLWNARAAAALSPDVAELVTRLADDGAAYALRNLFSHAPAGPAVAAILGRRGEAPPADIALAAQAVRARATAPVAARDALV
jgi:hypothetical protein